jgi:signal transduction histidine kinase
MSGLSRKLLAPNLVLAALVATALAQIAHEAWVETRAAEKEVGEVQRVNALLAQLNERVIEVNLTTFMYQYRREEGLRAKITRLNAEANGLVQEIGGNPLPWRGAALWREFMANHGLLEAARDELLALKGAGSEGAVEAAYAKWQVAAEQRAALLADFTTYNVKRLGLTTAALSARRARWLVTLGVVIACSIVLVILSSAVVTRTVLRPLASMTTTADRIATERVPLQVQGEDRADEIGVLARAFNRMTSHLVDANTRLAESVRARDEFLSVASHELKTPITSVKLQLQIEGRRLAERGEDARPRWLEVSLRQIARLESLISSLLDVTRMRAGRLDVKPEEVELAGLVSGVVDRFSLDLARSGNAVRLELERGVVGRWDPGRLDQVVTNLLTNVVKYAPGALLEVEVRRRDGQALLVLRDQGPGLPDEVRERAFHPFERASTTRNIGGLGLGLYIAKGIVDAHGGTIAVDSQLGAGAAFVVTLPLGDSTRPPSGGDAVPPGQAGVSG